MTRTSSRSRSSSLMRRLRVFRQVMDSMKLSPWVPQPPSVDQEWVVVLVPEFRAPSSPLLAALQRLFCSPPQLLFFSLSYLSRKVERVVAEVRSWKLTMALQTAPTKLTQH